MGGDWITRTGGEGKKRRGRGGLGGGGEMKFGKFLRASRVKGWEDYYVDYKKLTRAVKVVKRCNEGPVAMLMSRLTLDALESTPLSGGCFQDVSLTYDMCLRTDVHVLGVYPPDRVSEPRWVPANVFRARKTRTPALAHADVADTCVCRIRQKDV
eukprot:403727-Hanusia_phi.AAC.1